MTTTVAFYAYKGGTGRTLALIHGAWALAREGRRVLMIDLDLGAPSLWPLLGTNENVRGFVELFNDWVNGKKPSITDYVRPLSLDSRASGALFVMSAGMMDEAYLESIENLDWYQLVERQPLPASEPQQLLYPPRKSFLDYLSEELQAQVDLDGIFIDAPTGLTDTANVCLRVLADTVVALFQPTPVQLAGVGRVVSVLTTQQEHLRSAGEVPRPDVYCVASMVMSRRMGGTQMERLRRSFAFLDRVRFEALGRPPITVENEEMVEQSPAIITYEPGLAELERFELSSGPADSQAAVYEDISAFLRQCIPGRARKKKSLSLMSHDKQRALDDLEPHFEQFAEQETSKLERYFFRAAHIDRLSDAVVVIVLGGKGSGKTALFLYATRNSQDGKVEHCAVHGPGSIGLRPDLLVELERRVPDIDTLWRTYCLAQTSIQTKELSSTVAIAVRALRQLREDSVGFGQAVTALSSADLPVEIDRAWLSIDTQFGAEGRRLVLYVDGLDVAFKGELEQRKRGIASLLLAWQATFSHLKHIHLKVFLRTDLWEKLSFPEKSHLQPRTIPLNWTPQDLWRLLLKRALHSSVFSGICNDTGIEPHLTHEMAEAASSSVVYSYLDVLLEQRIWRGKNTLARNWVMRRLSDAKDTVYPRDILFLLQESIRKERDRLRNEQRTAVDAVLSRDSLVAALAPTSSQRVEALREEYPELAEILDALKGLPAKGDLGTLLSRLKEISSVPSSDALDTLQRTGVLKIAQERDYEVPWLYQHGLSMTRLGPK